jgi:Domain of unknown function (DUF4471)
MVRGFWGDIVNSPYWAFGVEINCCLNCSNVLNQVANTDRVHHEGDISDFNLTRMLNRLETFNEHHFPPEKDRMRAYKKMWANEEIKEVDEEAEKIEEIKLDGFLLPGFQKFNVKVVPVLDTIKNIAGKRKYKGIFDRIVIGGASNVKDLEALSEIGKDSCVFTIETVK